jgi:hypothetical protein
MKQRARKTEDTFKTFQSATCSMYDTLKYFFGFQHEDISWVELRPEEVLELPCNGPLHLNKYMLRKTWHQVIHFVLSRRNTILIPLLEEIKTAIKVLPKETADQFMEDNKPKFSQFMVYLEQWAHDNYKEQKKKSSAFKKTAMVPRQMQQPPPALLSQVKELGQVFLIAFIAISNSTFNWMVSPKNNNTNAVRSRFAKAIILEVVAHVQQRVPLVERNVGLYTFREDFKHIISSCPLLTNFQFWCPHNQPIDLQDQQKQYEDTLVEQNKQLVKSLELDGKFKHEWESFAKRLAKPGLLGIPIFGEDDKFMGHSLHPALQEKFWEFYNVSY